MAIPLHTEQNQQIAKGSHVPNEIYYNIDVNTSNGGSTMNKQNYVTHDELTISELKTQNQLNRIENKIDTLSNQVTHAISEDIPKKIELSLLKEREYQQQQQKDNRRFFWSAIIIGGISAIAAIGGVVATIFF